MTNMPITENFKNHLIRSLKENKETLELSRNEMEGILALYHYAEMLEGRLDEHNKDAKKLDKVIEDLQRIRRGRELKSNIPLNE